MSHFNDNAASWDTPQKIQLMGPLAARTIQTLGLSPDTRLDMIDFGCGTGLFGLEFADYARSLTGIDTSEGMLEVFRKKTAGEPHIRGISVDLEQQHQSREAELANIRADLILSCMAFHHLKQPADVLKQLKPLLSANGSIAIVDLDEEDGTFHPNNKEMGVKHFGFSNEAVAEWAKGNELSLHREIIHTVERDDRRYPIFLAVMKPIIP